VCRNDRGTGFQPFSRKCQCIPMSSNYTINDVSAKSVIKILHNKKMQMTDVDRGGRHLSERTVSKIQLPMGLMIMCPRDG
jgi:hypothetical protein